MWRSNPKAWATKQFFIEWNEQVIAPSVKKYVEENNFSPKSLLMLDIVSKHPPGLEENPSVYGFIQEQLSSPNTAPLIQRFKKLCTKGLSQKCFDVTDRTELTLMEFWERPLQCPSRPKDYRQSLGRRFLQDDAICLGETLASLWYQSET